MTTMRHPRWIAICSFVFAATLPLLAYAKLSKTGSATAGFKASGPGGLQINGTTSDLSVSDDGTTVSVEVKMTAISTGIALRDKHTRDYLDAATFPTAKLDVARASLKFPESGKETSGDATGKMTIHGVTKDAAFHYTAKKDGDTISVTASTPVNMNNYGVKTPSYLGVAVKPDITVTASFQAKDN
jgi:polyisoprenoid-binding protein YceI